MAVALALACASWSCRTVYQAHFVKPSRVEELSNLKDAPFLKCHLKNGGVIVLEAWSVDDVDETIRGYGVEYDAYRQSNERLEARVVKLDDIALLETNRPYDVHVASGSIVALAIGTGATLALTAVCLANAKACFGSCPTFFADDGNGLALQAEGFSESIARSLEATDVDAMWTVKPHGPTLDVVMTNDALETHVVDSVRVLAALRPPSGRVLRVGDRYFAVTRFTAPTWARAASQDVTDALRASDGVEYKSPASETDLAEREDVDVHFITPRNAKHLGLLVVDRNSLLNTFLFYQSLAYAGHRVGDYLTALEEKGKAAFSGVGSLLGDIEVSVRDARGVFVHAGKVGEVGPIAREAELVLLPDPIARSSEVDVRLTMARGNWRIDQLPVVGAEASVELYENEFVSGELLAATNDTLVVRTNHDPPTVRTLDASHVKHVDVRVFHNDIEVGLLGAWAAVGTLGALSHGFFFVFTGPAWTLLGTATVAPVAADPDRFTSIESHLGLLSQYARFPSGLPAKLDESRLAAVEPHTCD